MSVPATDRVVIATVRGASRDEARADQNAVAVRDDPRVGATIVAIAGAHGDARRVRSHIGARIAADVGATKAEAAVAALPSTDASALAALGEVLAARIADQWHAQVREHLASQPAAEDDQGADPLSSYDTALLLVLVTPAAVLALQLGDGDVVLRTRDGEVLRPLADDGGSDSNDADSLALEDAQARFRHAAVDRTARDLALVLVAAGLDDAQADREWRATLTSDVIAQAEREGIDSVDGRLPDRLAGTARVDGDDVTVALVFPAPAAAAVPVADTPDPRFAATMANPAVGAGAATAAVPAAATSAVPQQRAAATNERRRRRRIMTALAAVVVLLAIGAVVALSHDSGNTAPDTTVTTTPATTRAPTSTSTSPSTTPEPSAVASTAAPPSTAAPSTAPSTAVPPTTSHVVVTVPTTAAPPRTTTPTRPPATTTVPPATTAPTVPSSPPTT